MKEVVDMEVFKIDYFKQRKPIMNNFIGQLYQDNTVLAKH
jgi:hypothetical protein